MATNCYRSELKRIPAVTYSLDDALMVAAGQANLSDTADLHDAIRQAVLALPARYRDTLVLFYFHARPGKGTERQRFANDLFEETRCAPGDCP